MILVLKCKFNFAVMASGFKSGSLPHLKYYRDQINIPTMHIYGSNDQIIPKGKMKLHNMSNNICDYNKISKKCYNLFYLRY